MLYTILIKPSHIQCGNACYTSHNVNHYRYLSPLVCISHTTSLHLLLLHHWYPLGLDGYICGGGRACCSRSSFCLARTVWHLCVLKRESRRVWVIKQGLAYIKIMSNSKTYSNMGHTAQKLNRRNQAVQCPGWAIRNKTMTRQIAVMGLAAGCNIKKGLSVWSVWTLEPHKVKKQYSYGRWYYRYPLLMYEKWSGEASVQGYCQIVNKGNWNRRVETVANRVENGQWHKLTHLQLWSLKKVLME